MASVIDMINLLDANKSALPRYAAGTPGPLRPIYTVEFRHLVNNPGQVPKSIAKLISAIDKSGGPYDMAKKKTSRGDETMGAMRQIHSNRDPTWLPIQTKNPLSHMEKSQISGRMRGYDDYVTRFKKQTNDNGGGNTATGYVEFTASEQGTFDPQPDRPARIVFDYVNSYTYFSPLHYHSWIINGNAITLVSGNSEAMTANLPNAFYLITEITTVY